MQIIIMKLLKVNRKDKNDYLEMFVLSCIVGFVCEFVVGWGIYAVIGKFLWFYPTSPLQTTSLLVIPVWGLAGLLFLRLWKFVKKYDIF